MTSAFAMTSSRFNGEATAALHGEKVFVDEAISAAPKFREIVGIAIVRGINWIGLGLAFRGRPPLGAN